MGYVYRYMRGDEWIYVGKTKNPISVRIEAHSKEDKFLPYLHDCKVWFCEFEYDGDMDIAELAFIKIYKPILNTIGKTSAPFPFVPDESKIKWISYDTLVDKKKKKRQLNLLKKWDAKLRSYAEAYHDFTKESFLRQAAEEVSHVAMRYIMGETCSCVDLDCPGWLCSEIAVWGKLFGCTVLQKNECLLLRIPSKEVCETVIWKCGAQIEFSQSMFIDYKKSVLQERTINGISRERAYRMISFIESAIKKLENELKER